MSKNTVFPKGFRPVNSYFDGSDPDAGGMFTYFHYPGQRFTSYFTMMNEWKTRVNKTNDYWMIFETKDVEVIRHRNKPKQRCLEDWWQHDQMIIADIIQEAGCRPPHWNTTRNSSLCSTPDEMQHFAEYGGVTTVEVQKYDPPCRVIKSVDIRYVETDSSTQRQDIENNLIY